MARTMLTLTALAMLAGCSSTIPSYEPMEPEAAWQILVARAATIESIRAEADATLSASDASSLRVDGVLLLEAPNRARLRAWKLGHAVLDLTVNADGLWFDAPSPPDGAFATSFGVAPRDLAEGLLLLAGWSYTRSDPTRARKFGDRYEFDCQTDSGMLRCEVDARTLVPTSLWRIGDDGTRLSVELDRYRVVGNVPWAHRASLRAGDRSIVLLVRDVSLNEPAPPGAFVPPTTAGQIR